MENKDSSSYQSRKFKLSLTGTAQPVGAAMLNGGTFKFRIPPPSDIAFSDKYRSCLILLRSISIMNVRGARVLTGVGQITGEGLNPGWITDGAAPGPANYNPTDPTAGVVIETDLPCKQHATAQLDEQAQTTGTAGSGRYTKTIPNFVNKNSAFGQVAADQNLDIDGAQEIRIGGGAAAHGSVLVQRRPVWYWRTDADILDEGLLGATPFGRDLTITLKDARTNTECWLKSCGVAGGIANIQHQRTSIIAEFEFLMMR